MVKLKSSSLREAETEMGVFSFPCFSSSTIRYLFYLFFYCSMSSALYCKFYYLHTFSCAFFFCSYTIISLLCCFTLILCLSVIKKILFAVCTIAGVTVLQFVYTLLPALFFFLFVKCLPSLPLSLIFSFSTNINSAMVKT